MERVEPGKQYQNEDVRVEVDGDHLRIFNLLTGRFADLRKNTAEMVLEFRDRNSVWIDSPLELTREKWEWLKSKYLEHDRKLSMFPADGSSPSFWLVPSFGRTEPNPEEFYVSSDRWTELTKFFDKI